MKTTDFTHEDNSVYAYFYPAKRKIFKKIMVALFHVLYCSFFGFVFVSCMGCKKR